MRARARARFSNQYQKHGVKMIEALELLFQCSLREFMLQLFKKRARARTRARSRFLNSLNR